MKHNRFKAFCKNNFQFNLITVLFFILAVQTFLPVGAKAQESRELIQEKAGNLSEKRTALIIGNGDYLTARKLSNPVNDATDMAKSLGDLGFEVIWGTNLSLKQMNEKIREFGDRLKKNGGVGLFYYAGHGIQVNGRNFLIPVEADIPREDEVDFSALDLEMVLRKMAVANNGLNIVILDACRNNPFARSWSRGEDAGGLAQTRAPEGTYIAYATSPDKTASDGTGRNGLYTAELLKYIRQPNLKIEEVFKEVRKAVDRASNGKQIPWESSSLRGEFYFKTLKAEKSDAEVNPLLNNKTVPPSIIPDKEKAEQEKQAWESIRNESDPEFFRIFLKGYPNGENAAKAQNRLEEIVWESARANWDKAKIQAYLAEFPQGKNSPEARRMLDKLAWETVRGSRDKAKLEAYLKEFPEGEFAPSAKIELKKLEAIEGNGSTESNKNVRRNLIGMSLVYIPPGQFLMGSSNEEVENARQARKSDFVKDELPQHPVTIKNGFWLSRFEVTQEQWESIMGNNPSGSKSTNCRNCPVENVSWNDAQEFIRRLNAKNDEFEYRLPTEAEWEYAARAETKTVFAFGNSLNSNQANFRGDAPYGEDVKLISKDRTVFVGSYEPNGWGLYDMHGNVAEWCEDVYAENYNGFPNDGSANLKGDSSNRVIRGGSWTSGGFTCRSASRDSFPSDKKFFHIGFRVAARIKN